MAISTTRVKFLDKENKILVKPIKDFISNEIFSDFVTSFLDTDLVSSFLGQQSLLDLQSGISGLTSFLTDDVVSNFSINTLLTGVNFNTPQLAHLATTIDAIKGMDNKTVSLFVSSLLEVTTDKLTDNPSLINLYQSVSSDAKTQMLLSSLDVFATKLSTGKTTVLEFTNQLRQASGGDFDLAKVNTLLDAVKSNTKTVNLSAVVAGSATLAASFLQGLTALEVKEAAVIAGVGGATGATDISGAPAIAADVANLKVTDPDVSGLLIAYLSVKQVYILAHLRSTSAVYLPATFLTYVQTPAGKAYISDKLTGAIKVSPGVQADILIKALSSLLGHMQTNAESLSLSEFTELFTTITSTIDSGLDFLLSETKSSIDTSFSSVTAVSNAVNYINNPLYTAADGIEFEGFNKNPEIDGLLAHVKALTSSRLVTYLELLNAKRDADGVGGIIAYTTMQMLKYLIGVSNHNLKSYYALVNVMRFVATSIFSFTASLAVAQKGFSLDDTVIDEGSLTEHVGVMSKLYGVIDKSKVTTAAITTIPEAERPLYQALKDFNSALTTAVGAPSASVDYDSYTNLGKIYELYKARTSVLDDVKFVTKAVDMEQVAFSASSDAVTIL